MYPALESPHEPRTGVLMDRIHVYICIYLRYDPSQLCQCLEREGGQWWCSYQLGNQPDGGGGGGIWSRLLDQGNNGDGRKVISLHLSHDRFKMDVSRSNENMEHRRWSITLMCLASSCSNRIRFLLDFEMTFVTWDRTVFLARFSS